MSSMVSYSVGGYASTETVLKSWLKHFIENENKLIKDLKTEEAFKNLWIYDILNKDKLSNIENEFKLLYSDWTYDNVSNDLREEILKNMEDYVYLLKESLLREEINFISNLNNNKIQKSKDVQLEKKENYAEIIDFYLQKIGNVNQKVFLNEKTKLENIKDFTSQRAKLFLDSLKLLYLELNIKNNKIEYYRNSILNMYNILKSINLKDLNLIERIDNFLKSDIDSEDIYNNLYKIMQEKYEELYIKNTEQEQLNNIINSLQKLDYLVIDDKKDLENKLRNKENIILDSKDKDYAIFIKINKENQLLTRFVRKIDSEDDKKNITDSQKILDKENLQHWCSLLDDFSKELKNEGIIYETNIIENNKSDVLYYFDRNKTNNLPSNKQKKVKTHE
ncbi:hypothetical protein [Aliarcobacter cryaerophilus]|uniref:hypothetical protein n=1 Tax=Aliarcobacter cryaerophilus TaxID=28198 RepID=UPI003DA2FA61